MRDKAIRIFNELLDKCVRKAGSIGIAHRPPLRIMHMKKRWGSCTATGSIILNPELLAAPRDCIEYLILHELCHLKVRNHTPEFYRKLHSVCPNWEALRLKLNQTVELSLEY